MNKLILNLITLIAIFCLAQNAHSSSTKIQAIGHSAVSVEKQVRISNSFLTVSYNPESKSLEVFAKSASKSFLNNMIPANIRGAVEKGEISSPVFGKGSSLIFPTTTGGSISFTLYPSQPFLFVNQTVKNEGTAILDVQKLNPVSFLVDLGKSANELKTLGTGGLLAPDKNPGSYVFLTTVDPATRNGVVTGWLTHEKGSGVLFSGIKNNSVEIKSQIDYGHLRLSAGKSEATETLLIGYFDDARLGEEQLADAIASDLHIALKPRSAVYCSWYSEKNGGAGSEESTIELAGFIQKNLKDYGLGAVQIDDQWQDGGKYISPRKIFDRVDPNGKYPNGMEKTAKAIKDAGLLAGIWWMPFSRNHQDVEFKDLQHWFGYRLNGKHFSNPFGSTSLDLTNPEVVANVSALAQKLHSWGYNYFKMDGLWTGTVTDLTYINDGYKNDSIGNCKPLFNPLKTQIEAYRDGLKSMRNAVGDEVFFSGCCASQNMRSFGASFGLVNSMRIGPDFNHDGESIRTGAIRASRLYFLNGRIWWNDPDPSMLRESGTSTADGSAKGIGNIVRAKLLPSFVALSGQFFLSSDWLPDLPADRIEIMKRTMASHSGIARPVDAFDQFLPEIWLASDQKTGTERNVIGLFNWKTTSQKIGSSLKWTGLNESKSYYAFDFWNNKPLSDIANSFSYELPAESCQIIAVRAKSGHPVVVSTSQHVTQGMIDLLKEDWKSGTLSGTSKLIAGDTYELRIAGLNDGANWKIEKVSLLENQDDATIVVLPQTEKGWLKVIIKSSKNQTVKWQLKFIK